MIKYVLVFLLASVWNVAATGLREGAPCMADGYPGTCRLWRNCITLLLDRQELNFPPLCSFKGGDPVICCTSCLLVEDVSKIVLNPRGLFLWKTDQISWNKCIDYFIDLPYQLKDNQKGQFIKEWNNTRSCFVIQFGIVGAAGGRDAKRAEFPHMALLGYGTSDESIQWLCGGSLISERFILTAGHCISSASAGPVTYAALGILKRSDPEDLWQKYRIQSVIPHPMYKSPSKYHDIALLKTEQTITFNLNVMPACLPNLAKVADDEKATAAGWGTVGPRTQPADTLQVVEVQKFSSTRCSMLYGIHRHLTRGYDENTQMCYGNQDQIRDTCSGDSGGPLQILGQIYYEQRTIIGVTSYGPDCGYPGQGGMYTRVRRYVPWIESIVWK